MILILFLLAPIALSTNTIARVHEVCPSPCGADIVFVLDTSGSMSNSFGNTTRIDALKNATITFINMTCTDGQRWIGLVWYEP